MIGSSHYLHHQLTYEPKLHLVSNLTSDPCELNEIEFKTCCVGIVYVQIRLVD